MHPFLFHSSSWLGEGKLSFSTSDEVLHFYTRWVVAEPVVDTDKVIVVHCTQEVEMADQPEDKMCNRFQLHEITNESFEIVLQNEQIGTVIGKGVIEPRKIAWEFRGNPNFEGFEVYELEESEEYTFHAEYVSTDQYRSIIDGRIWKRMLE
ncbi:MAG: hypothetical protein KDK48_04060 [Chlamydiia bacterium]|nr:hypothetical protein [Chlamydiia bacterium]